MKVKKELFEKHVKSFEPGAAIFNEGDKGEELYVVIEGEVEIRKSTFRSSAKTLITLGSGDIFGEMAIIEKKSRSATAIATKQTKLLVINEALYDNIIDTNPDFARKMIRILSERLRRANTILKGLMTTNREKMIFKELKLYANEHGTPTFKGLRVNEEQFIDWACKHIGVGEKALKNLLFNLEKKKIITASAVGTKEFILSAEQ